MLEQFFSPKSVAIIGASHTPGKIGYSILENFVRGNFKGKVYPVNPDATPIFNLAVYPSVKKIPEEVDLVVIAVKAEIVPKILKECVEKKVKAVIIISGGFSEIGESGRSLEEKCKKIISKKNIRVIGPNVVGVYDSSTAVDTLFLSRERMQRPSAGSISFISQSGAVGSTILDSFSEEKIGISKFISYGNAMDVNEIDLLEFLANDEKTKTILIYLEGIKSEGKKFISTVKKISKKKPIIVLKAGKTERGNKAVFSHTGSLAGSSKIYSSVFKQTGMIEADSLEDIFDLVKAFQQPLPKNNSVAIVTDGGGFGVLATDEAERQNLQLQGPSKTLKEKLKKSLPSYVILENPFDLTGDATAERYQLVMEECLKSKEYSGVIAITLFQVPTLNEKITEIIKNLSNKYNKPILCCALGGRFTRRLVEFLEAGNIPVYPMPERAVKAFAALVKYAEFLKKK
jgi:acetyl coenzyme A synthetase (ADP forming)-like protein